MTRPGTWMHIASWSFALCACAGSKAVDGIEVIAPVEAESPVADGAAEDASSNVGVVLDASASEETWTPSPDAAGDRGSSGPVLTTIEPSWEECAGAAVPLDITGTTPLGVFHVERAVLEYTASLAFSTTMEFRGTVGGRKARIVLSVGDEDHVGPAPAGIYRAQTDKREPGGPVAVFDDGTVLVHSDGSSSGVSNYLEATIEIEEHDFDATAPGSNVPTRLRGSVEVDEPGWSLRVPFDFDFACNYLIYAI